MSLSLEKFHQFSERLLAAEQSSIETDREAPLSIALIFPNSYEIGMANLGFQTLFRLLNSQPGVRCERSFLYKSFPDISRTLESRWLLTHFDVIAFSLSFELDYLNLVRILENTGLNLFAAERHPHDPLIIAGGTTTFINPQPIAPFIDLFVLGEAEPVLPQLIEHLKAIRESAATKEQVLVALSNMDGFYVPAFHQPGRLIRTVRTEVIGSSPQFSAIVTPNSHFQNMFLIEVGRGCGRFCRFCAASHVYHPVRFFTPETIIETITTNIHSTDKIGLVGAALCDYPHLYDIGKKLVEQKYKLGLSSFRFDSINREFLDIIEAGGIRTITLAPEAGTETLRRVINKPITDEQIMHSVELLAKSGIQTLKLYFLIGLPFETDADLQGIIELSTRVRNLFFTGSAKRRDLTISANAFVPKPFTPFQWAPMEIEKNLKMKRRFLDREFRKINSAHFVKKNTRQEIMQGILSVGNRQLAEILQRKDVSLPDFTHLIRDFHQVKKLELEFPWDFIEYPVRREKMWHLWQKSATITKQ